MQADRSALAQLAAEQGDEASWTPELIRLDTVEPEEVSFLWRPYIPKAKLTLLNGPPGLGKTHLAMSIASIVSNGHPFPGDDGIPQEQREPGTVLVLTAEDGIADTLVPRLLATGADMARVYVLQGSVEHPDDGMNLSTDMFLLNEAAQQVKPSLIIIDPIQGYIGGVDMHRANEVRPVLTALARLAEEHACAVLAIGHMTKGSSERAIYRVLGSIDFVAAARSMLLLDQHPDDENLRVLAHAKSNLAPLGRSQTFRLVDGAIQWSGAVDLTAEDLNAPYDRSSEERGSRDEAIDWLRDILQDGPQYSQDLIKRAKDELGVSERTLKRAKAAIDAGHFKEPGRGGRWMWELSNDDKQGNHDKETGGTVGAHTSNPLLDGVTGKYAKGANGNLDIVGTHENEAAASSEGDESPW